MVDIDAITVWQLVVTILPVGGAIIFSLECFRDWLFKRRVEFVEQSKQKIDVISKAAPYYNQLAMNSWSFGWNVIEVSGRDYERLMYHMCNMLYFRHEIVRKFGDLQFDNLDAEKIINDIWQQIFSLVERHFGYLDTSKLRCLVENDIPYHKFHESLLVGENKELYNKFLKWIVTELSKQDCEIIESCMWYCQLIQLELNHIYKLWYGEEPPLVLRAGLNEYLKKNQKKYYDRINSFHLKNRLSSKP